MELVCLAVQQKREGNTALAKFIAIAKEFVGAESKLARLRKRVIVTAARVAVGTFSKLSF